MEKLRPRELPTNFMQTCKLLILDIQEECRNPLERRIPALCCWSNGKKDLVSLGVAQPKEVKVTNVCFPPK